jgi:hypothetical protein
MSLYLDKNMGYQCFPVNRRSLHRLEASLQNAKPQRGLMSVENRCSPLLRAIGTLCKIILRTYSMQKRTCNNILPIFRPDGAFSREKLTLTGKPRKKRITILGMFLGLFCSLYTSGFAFPAKTYQVIKVRGQIQNLTQKYPLIVKQRFSPRDQLQFSSQTDRLAVIDEARITYIIKPHPDLKSYDIEPIRAKYNTRPGEILTYISFVKYLEGKDFLVLSDQVKLKIEAPDLPIDNEHFFFIRYKLEDETKPINKKLRSEENQIIISKAELFKVDDKAVSPESASDFELFYYNSAESKSLKINTLSLVFPDKTSLKEELEIIISSFGDIENQKETLRKAIENYLMEVYGVPEKENLDQWLKGEYGL